MDLTNPSWLDANYLWASVIWSAVGMGYFVYGKRQQALGPLFGGIFIMGASYFITSAAGLSALSLAIMAAIYFLGRD
ncbi:MAG: amino acid transport protein [Verrucomicrobiota bacterium]